MKKSVLIALICLLAIGLFARRTSIYNGHVQICTPVYVQLLVNDVDGGGIARC